MSIDRNTRNETTSFARFAAAILFVMLVGIGHTVSPQVKGAVESPAAAEEQEITEPAFLPSDCAVDGLVFADCNLEF